MIYLKKLFNPTILGLTLGILLVGYSVFAFTPPTTAPPAGNVDAPINTGADSQTKQGGLWVNNGLVVGGGVRIGRYATIASRPTCSSSIDGTLIFDTTVEKAICMYSNVGLEAAGF